jgi:hypothetical protein
MMMQPLGLEAGIDGEVLTRRRMLAVFLVLVLNA